MTRSGRTRARRMAVGALAVGVATSVAGVAATQPASISTPPVDLAALIVIGSSTNPSGAGVEDFFQGKFADPLYTGSAGDDIVSVDFLSGLAGIQQALAANANESNALLASGWGAANVGLLLRGGDTSLRNTVVVLDNDVARPDGGFGTRYPWFALIGVNPLPTPSDTEAQAVVSTGYEYDYNSNAPADVLNPLAAVNSLVAYLYRRLNQAELDLPVNVDGTPAVQCGANTCAITESGAVLDCEDARCASPSDRITAYVTTRGNTTYVTYTSDGLPLANLMRDVLPFGEQIADLTEPLLKVAVDSAYYDGNPIPRDPSAYRPARLFPSPTEIISTVAKVPGAIQQGLTAAANPQNAPQTADTSGAQDVSFAPFGRSGTKPSTNVARPSEKAVPRRDGFGRDTGNELKAPDASQDSAAGGAGEAAQSEDSPNDASDSES